MTRTETSPALPAIKPLLSSALTSPKAVKPSSRAAAQGLAAQGSAAQGLAAQGLAAQGFSGASVSGLSGVQAAIATGRLLAKKPTPTQDKNERRSIGCSPLNKIRG